MNLKNNNLYIVFIAFLLSRKIFRAVDICFGTTSPILPWVIKGILLFIFGGCCGTALEELGYTGALTRTLKWCAYSFVLSLLFTGFNLVLGAL